MPLGPRVENISFAAACIGSIIITLDLYLSGTRVSEPSRRERASLPLLVAAAGLASLLIVPFVLPLHSLPVTTFYQEWMAIALGCITFVASIWPQQRESLAIPRSVVLPAGLCLLLLIQALFGRLEYWQVGVLGVLYLLWSIAMLCSGATLHRRIGADRFCALAAWALCAGAVVGAVIGLLQLMHWRAGGLIMPMIGPRVHANLAQPNHFAAYTCLGLFSLCFLYVRGDIRRPPAAVVSVLLLLAADLSGSRSIWAYVGAAMLMALWSHWRARTGQTRTLLYTVALVLAGMALVSMLTTSLSELAILPGDSLSGIHSGGKRLLGDLSGTSHRREIWSAAWHMFEGAPLVGVGFGGFAYQYFVSRNQSIQGMPEEIVDHAHNLILQMLAEFGLPGAILLAVTALAWYAVALRSRAGAQQWWTVTLVSVIGLHSLIEYPLWYAYFLGPLALLVGTVDRPLWRPGAARLARTTVIGAAGVILWLLISVFVDYRITERFAIESAAARDNRDVIIEAASASRTSVFGHFVELGIARTIALDQQALDAKLALNGRVLHQFPAPDVAYRQSALTAMRGNVDAAYRLWDQAADAYPGQSRAVARALAQRVTAGEFALAPLVEYAASRNRGSQ